jgi:ribosomal protein L7/L12
MAWSANKRSALIITQLIKLEYIVRQKIQDSMTILLKLLDRADRVHVLQTLATTFNVTVAHAQYPLPEVPSKVGMIKALRTYSGCDLRDAKQHIDAYIDLHRAQEMEHICARVHTVLRVVGYNE